MRRLQIQLLGIFMVLALVAGPIRAAGEQPAKTIPPGTVITPRDWQQYKQFMNRGLRALFSGQYFWKLPPDFQLVVAPPFHYSDPKLYQENTEKYFKTVKIIDLPDGGHSITGYVAGRPFPNPTEPLRGWKLLVDDWFTYQPHLICAPECDFYTEDRFYNRAYGRQVWVIRRFSRNSDPGFPIDDPRGKGIDLFEYTQILKPEQAKYTTVLTVYYTDIAKIQDSFLFIPALRRSLRLSPAARCSPFNGTDYIYDDTRHGNFNGNLTQFNAVFLGERYVLIEPRISDDWKMIDNLDNYYLPLFFPKPSLGQWDLRHVWLIDVRPIPSYASSYCISRRLLYIDQESYDSDEMVQYDNHGKLWKVTFGGSAIVNTPGVGKVWTNGGMAVLWDLQNNHASVAMLPFRANQDCTSIHGVDYRDIGRFSSLAALAHIMR